MSSDRNLLFGIVAVQMNFIDRDALIKAMNAWILEKHRTLGEILVQQGQLGADRRQLLDALVVEHLKAHDNDPQKSMAALSSLGEIARSLKQVADGDVQRTLESLPQADATRTVMHVSRDAGVRFRVLRPHAQGGLGEVFVAEDTELHREVALKEIQPHHADNPSSRGRFLMEAEVTGGLEHPGIVPVYGLGTYADGRPFYAMRFIRGDSLKEAIERFHGTSVTSQGTRQGFDSIAFRQLLRRFQDVCNAIAYAHSRGILHRDLKPGNIMLGLYGETLVVDWGLAKPIGREQAGPANAASERTLQPVSGSGYVETQMGSVVGTPAFMSPEQAAGRLEELGPASDIYSLGATFYVLLSGQVPFQGPIADVLKKVENGEFPPPRQVRHDVPQSLNAIALKAMARRRDDRYPSASALSEEIDRFLADEPVLAYREPFVVRGRRWARKHRTLVTTGGATAMLLLVGLIAGTIVLGDKNRLLAQTNSRLDTANGDLTKSNKQLDSANDSLKKTNVDLDAARQDAVAKRIAAEKAQETTAEQRRLALDTVRDVLLRVDDLMKNDTKLVPLRLEIIRRMLVDVDQIRDHARKNPLEDRTEAIAYSRMGEIYYRANRMQDADEWQARAYAVLKVMVNESPNDPNAQRNLAAICHQFGDTQWRLGNGKKARELHAEGLRLGQQRQVQLKPSADEMDTASAASDVAESFAHVAYADLRLGEPLSAVQNYLAADEAYAHLPPPTSSFLKVRRSRAEIQVRLGDAQSRLRNNDAALKHYLKALEDREAMLQLLPPRREMIELVRTDVGQSRMYLGDFLLFIRKDHLAANEQYRIALKLFQQVLQSETDRDNFDVQQRIGATHYRLGVTAGRRTALALLTGAAAEASPIEHHFAESLRIRAELGRIDPKDMQCQVELLLAQARVGQTAEAERTAAAMLAQAPTDRQVLFQTACGLAILAGGKSDAAARWRESAFQVLDTLVKQGWKDPIGLETDPDFETIRADPRFGELLKRLQQ